MTRLAYLSLHVHDLSESLSFYGTYLGLPILQNEDWGIILGAGDVEIHLHQCAADHPSDHVELAFDVDDADVAVAHLREQGVRVLDEVTEREWGDRDGAVADPDGNAVYLRSKSELR